MLKSGFRLPFDLFGIPIRLDATFLLLIALLTWLIGGNVATYVEMFELPIEAAPLEQGATPYLLGLLSAIGLMISVLVHELSHALTARRYGVEIKEIRLWILGGIAQFSEMPKQPRAEAVVAIVGPITSAVLGVLLWGITGLIAPAGGALLVVLSYLAAVNIVLAVFNLLPALPMDGGRVLRSLLALRMGHLRATRVSAGVSQVLAVLLGLLGLATFNLFMVAIAFFIWIAVKAEAQFATVEKALENVEVRDLMSDDPVTVRTDMTVEALTRHMFTRKHVFFPVVSDEGELIGSIRLQDIDDAEPTARVEEVMARDVATIDLHAGAAEAFKRINESSGRRLIVTGRNGEMVGIVSTTDLLRAVQIRMAEDG
ncbi:MAG: site-2 protease family protein [Trueperaceae bacterium]|nr:site-2 protease family protein [Trueperaceae bacterium]